MRISDNGMAYMVIFHVWCAINVIAKCFWLVPISWVAVFAPVLIYWGFIFAAVLLLLVFKFVQDYREYDREHEDES